MRNEHGADPLKIVVAGLSITSSWGNGHATTYRALVRALAAAGHHVLFLERDVPWYAGNRDTPQPQGCELGLYRSLAELRSRHERSVQQADAVILGSFVPEGVAVGRWLRRTCRGVLAFYDIDTPVTLAKLDGNDEEYLSRDLIPQFDLYLSFTGGPTIERLEAGYGARHARPLYCCVDPERYRPMEVAARWALGYLGTYSLDRQPALDRFLVEPARRDGGRRYVVAGPTYPEEITWPVNVERIEHVAPGDHPAFYAGQRFTLNVTRAHMVRAGWSPSVRLFEAAACGVPIMSDMWDGIDEIFTPGREILLLRSTSDVMQALHDMTEAERLQLGASGRDRVLRRHTSTHRAAELVGYLRELQGPRSNPATTAGGAAST